MSSSSTCSDGCRIGTCEVVEMNHAAFSYHPRHLHLSMLYYHRLSHLNDCVVEVGLRPSEDGSMTLRVRVEMNHVQRQVNPLMHRPENSPICSTILYYLERLLEQLRQIGSGRRLCLLILTDIICRTMTMWLLTLCFQQQCCVFYAMRRHSACMPASAEKQGQTGKELRTH